MTHRPKPAELDGEAAFQSFPEAQVIGSLTETCAYQTLPCCQSRHQILKNNRFPPHSVKAQCITPVPVLYSRNRVENYPFHTASTRGAICVRPPSLIVVLSSCYHMVAPCIGDSCAVAPQPLSSLALYSLNKEESALGDIVSHPTTSVLEAPCSFSFFCSQIGSQRLPFIQ